MWDANPYYLILLAAIASVMASLLAIVLAELLLNGTISSLVKKIFHGISRVFRLSRYPARNATQVKNASVTASKESIGKYDLARRDIFEYLQNKLKLSAKRKEDDIAVGQDYVNYKSRVANYDELLVSYHTSLLLQKQLENVTENLLCLIGNKNYDGEIKFDYLPLEQTVRYSWYQLSSLNTKHRMLCDINIPRSLRVYSDPLKLELLMASVFCNVLCLYNEPKSAAINISKQTLNSNLVIKINTKDTPKMDTIQLFNMLYSDRSIANIFKRHEMCLAILKIIAELLNVRIKSAITKNGLTIEISGLLIV